MGLMQYPKRTGFLYSHKSLTVTQGTDALKGVTSFKISPKVDGRELQYATGPIALGRPRGNLVVEVEAEFSAQSWFDFISQHPSYLFEEFTFTAVYEEGSDRSELTIISLTFEENDIESEGTEAMTISLSGTALDLEINGVSVSDADALGNSFGLAFSVAGSLF